jgi:AraC family transcriptional regulator
MIKPLEILRVAQQGIDPSLDLLSQKNYHIQGSVQYSIKRFSAAQSFGTDDTGMLVYHYHQNQPDKNYLELRYCISGNRYCDGKNCSKCHTTPAASCNSHLQTIDIFSVHFTNSFLQQFTHNVKLSTRKDEVLAFKHPSSFTKTFPVCNRKRNALDGLVTHSYSGSLENIFINAKMHELLLYSLECLVDEKEEGFSCKFLANELDREKILSAREVLLQHIGDPITIKELSRKVAINECYLKKGFKEIFGTTIFDFYQQQRMEHAKYLLYEKGLNVTDVSALLGYSSISHFSTAFKKHTGLKPCELLLR